MTTRRLPLVSNIVLPPGVDQLRAQLGGRPGTIRFAEAGAVVVAQLAGGARTGVVLTADESGGYVWLDENEVRRVPRALLQPHEGECSDAIRLRAEVARAYGALVEGSEVEFTPREGGWTAARLVEKCRFGALVARADGVVLGVGFRALRALAS